VTSDEAELRESYYDAAFAFSRRYASLMLGERKMRLCYLRIFAEQAII
jgi:hypothetical protein